MTSVEAISAGAAHESLASAGPKPGGLASSDRLLRSYERWVGLEPRRIAALFGALTLLSWAVRLSMPAPWNFELKLSTLENPFFWLDNLNNLLLIYVFAAATVARRGVLSDLHELRPALALDEAGFAEWRQRLAAPDGRVLALWGAVGAALLGAGPIFDQGFWAGREPVPVLSLAMLFFSLRLALTGWIAGTTLASEFSVTRGFACLGANHLRVDPLDLRPLRPFARKGLRSAALWLIASSLVSLYWLGPAVMALNGVIVVAVFVLALLVFLYPAVAVNGAIRLAKEAKLDALRARIRVEEAHFDSGQPQDARLANLVAYYGLVAAAREWPIEAPTVLRFALFAMIGLGSWLGAALVERALESVF